MSAIVERVARALAYELDGEPEFTSPSYRAAMIKAARAAIEAMQKPTGDMIDAGAESYGYRAEVGKSRPELDGQPSKAWCAMIAAALTAKP